MMEQFRSLRGVDSTCVHAQVQTHQANKGANVCAFYCSTWWRSGKWLFYLMWLGQPGELQSGGGGPCGGEAWTFLRVKPSLLFVSFVDTRARVPREHGQLSANMESLCSPVSRTVYPEAQTLLHTWLLCR